ncbi:MAG TPA: PspC domain-containing protein [Oscillospiraceae bacterium]|nr:PspC domain-containing protein [Oscillospiraceae bacterium]
MKKLYRSRDQQMLGGVCMGIARYFNVDVTLIRLLWVIGGLAGGGIGLPAYIIAWIIIPEEPGIGEAIDISSSEGEAPNIDSRTVGLVVIAVGVFLLIRQFLPLSIFRYYLWPLAFIGVGLLLVWGGRK